MHDRLRHSLVDHDVLHPQCFVDLSIVHATNCADSIIVQPQSRLTPRHLHTLQDQNRAPPLSHSVKQPHQNSPGDVVLALEHDRRDSRCCGATTNAYVLAPKARATNSRSMLTTTTCRRPRPPSVPSQSRAPPRQCRFNKSRRFSTSPSSVCAALYCLIAVACHVPTRSVHLS